MLPYGLVSRLSLGSSCDRWLRKGNWGLRLGLGFMNMTAECDYEAIYMERGRLCFFSAGNILLDF